MRPTNASVIAAIRQLIAYTQLEDGTSQSFRTRAYEKAIDAIAATHSNVAEMSVSELREIDGIGDATARKIVEFASNGSIGKVERLKTKFPPTMLELMKIPGLGPKTVLRLQEHLGVTDVAGLEDALDKQLVRTLPGLGVKSEEKIARSIQLLGIHSDETRTPIHDAMGIAARVMAELSASVDIDRIEYAGSLRRLSETIGDIDILVASDDAASVTERFIGLPGVTATLGSGDTKASVVIDDRIQVDLRVVREENFGAAWLYFTGSKGHNIELRQRSLERDTTLNEYSLSSVPTGEVIAARTESEIYSALGLAWITPEVREGAGEIAAADAGALPRPVSVEDIKGDLHLHTDRSGDGRSTLEAMLDAASARGLEYVAITDHAENLTMNGLSRAEMLEQHAEIEEQRVRRPEMAILAGVELNIDAEGSIDYDPEFLELFDIGVASVHSYFDLDTTAQTARIIAAMENPAVTIIGHPTGRKIGSRPGIMFDLDAVLEAAVETGTALEINSSLQRLDLSAPFLRRAVEVPGVRFVISTDSHHASGLSNMKWGVSLARKGWVRPSSVLNSLPKNEFLAVLGIHGTDSAAEGVQYRDDH
ncbi:MAG: DNA polymerase/3'-5' exonuclease PolX [Actinomycetia bacterium]|nr:DNA polymerase/3'-5' exonuclease PolX [Actinomycetes bacterium]